MTTPGPSASTRLHVRRDRRAARRLRDRARRSAHRTASHPVRGRAEPRHGRALAARAGHAGARSGRRAVHARAAVHVARRRPLPRVRREPRGRAHSRGPRWCRARDRAIRVGARRRWTRRRLDRGHAPLLPAAVALSLPTRPLLHDSDALLLRRRRRSSTASSPTAPSPRARALQLSVAALLLLLVALHFQVITIVGIAGRDRVGESPIAPTHRSLAPQLLRAKRRTRSSLVADRRLRDTPGRVRQSARALQLRR